MAEVLESTHYASGDTEDHGDDDNSCFEAFEFSEISLSSDDMSLSISLLVAIFPFETFLFPVSPGRGMV